jgi:hypothetical protein
MKSGSWEYRVFHKSCAALTFCSAVSRVYGGLRPDIFGGELEKALAVRVFRLFTRSLKGAREDIEKGRSSAFRLQSTGAQWALLTLVQISFVRSKLKNDVIASFTWIVF